MQDSITIEKDEYSGEERFVFRFGIRLWNTAIADHVKSALISKGLANHSSEILPLPMQMVKFF